MAKWHLLSEASAGLLRDVLRLAVALTAVALAAQALAAERCGLPLGKSLSGLSKLLLLP